MSPQEAARLIRVLVHIQANLDGDLSLETLADEAGLSPHHFHRLFRAAMTETTQKYCERLRLERAAVNLLCYEETIVRTALDVGFQSHEVFCRAFKRRFGMTPRAYRKTLVRRRSRDFSGSHSRRTSASGLHR